MRDSPAILFLVNSDPRMSGRPAEALRIAAGIAVWKKVAVKLYLRGPAILALAERTDDLVDAENFERYLPVLISAGGELLVEAQGPGSYSLDRIEFACREITDAELARLAASLPFVSRF